MLSYTDILWGKIGTEEVSNANQKNIFVLHTTIVQWKCIIQVTIITNVPFYHKLLPIATLIAV